MYIFNFRPMKPLNYGRLLKKLNTEEDQIKFLQQHDILKTEINCLTCSKLLTKVYSHKDYYYFRCLECAKKMSIRTNSLLSNSKVSLRKFTIMAYNLCSNYFNYKELQV